MTAPSRARAARAVELQSAREAAGLTVEEVAGRIVDMWDTRLGLDRRKNWQSMVDKLTRHLAYLERASQGAYERADEWAQLAESERTGPRPRVRRDLWREALAVIRTGSPSKALAEVVLADALAQADNFRASEKRAQDAARERGGDLATLVWNAAEDPDFLDRALVDELAAVPPRHLAYLVRAALVDIADELRVTFPDRPSRDLRAVA